MIQRIQSLFITIAIICSGLLLTSPLAEILSTEKAMTFFAKGIMSSETTVMETIPMLIIVIAFFSIDIIALLSFRKRLLQIRFLTFSMVLKLGSYGLGAFYILQFKNDAGFEFLPQFAMVYPLIGFIFSLLAIRAIGKDEALIKSLDRIR